jgi:Lar family restriction alleviation protein
MTDDLKPCPFCGGKAQFMASVIATGDYYVTCTNCDATTAYARTQAGAVRAWNRRTDPGSSPSL